MKDVSEVEPVMAEEMESLERDDQLWLAECLAEYSTSSPICTIIEASFARVLLPDDRDLPLYAPAD
jgi:hypothetical protein